MRYEVPVRKIGDEYVVPLPQEAVECLNLRQDQPVELLVDKSGIQISVAQPNLEDDMERQLSAARLMMRKYHVALSRLAKE